MQTNTTPKLYNQRTKTAIKAIQFNGEACLMKVVLRYDDACKNGHNTFSITADITKRKRFITGGCLHSKIKKHFPELAHYIKWHLTSDNGPLYYVENTLYWLGYGKYAPAEPNMNNARKCAIWPSMPGSFLASQWFVGGKSTAKSVTDALNARLPELMQCFRNDMDAIKWDVIEERT